MLDVIELFAGIGSQTKALKRLGVPHKVVCICEWDKYAYKSYEAVHGQTHNLGDITKVERLPKCDLLTYSFPCQDLSVAGKGAGIKVGTRSGLLFEVERLLEVYQLNGELPKYLLLENVKNLVGKKNKPDFDRWLAKLSELGYNNYWKVLNAKDYGTPQNRERVFVVSILKQHDNHVFKWPEKFDNGLRLKHLLEADVDEKYYISDEKVQKLLAQIKSDTVCIDNSMLGYEGKPREYSDYMPAITAREYKEPRQVVVPCLTPDRVEKRQNGRRFKEDGDEMFTITTQDRHGVLVREATKQGYAVAHEGDSINLEHPNSKTRRGRVGKECAQTITTSPQQAVVIPNEINQVGNLIETDSFGGNPQCGRVYGDNGIAPTLNTCGGGQREPKVLTQYRIRKLTPKECWRLMGFDDEDFDKAAQVNSNSQLYKQAGNSIVVNVLEYIFKAMLDNETKKPKKYNYVEDYKNCAKGQMNVFEMLEGLCE